MLATQKASESEKPQCFLLVREVALLAKWAQSKIGKALYLRIDQLLNRGVQFIFSIHARAFRLIDTAVVPQPSACTIPNVARMSLASVDLSSA